MSAKQNNDSGQDGLARNALLVLAVLALLYTCYFASSLLIPLVLAAMLALPLHPAVHFLRQYYVPRAVSGVILLAAIGVPFTLLGMQLAEPAERWLDRAPELTRKVNQQLESLTEALVSGPEEAAVPAEEEASALSRLFGWFSDAEEQEKASTEAANQEISRQLGLRGLQAMLDIIAEMPVFLAQFFAVLILVLFMLVYGPGIYYAGIESMPQIRNKDEARALVIDTQRELSRYIFTVSVINLGLGLATSLALWLLNFEDPLFWGTLVALLNFAPYVGPLIAAIAISLAGFDQYGLGWAALVPTAVYFAINTLESQLVTPVALGRTVAINPLFTMIWLMLWGWLWGAAGVLIAVPLLVCIKLILSRLHLLEPWLKVIEAR
ncbi:AI-2E family transporter [Pseudohalioglobus sediminis]|uniref:AI-2E family transporter n=1 Tax=Pseudohalioglobus sediminis TaxID=2606449 RepID=A0A5B0WQY1_9GAMM|nr:AI-2E family transporter [Pseudohalioglobus sediminis]KAA1189226.1 AI-2E family transporter [Pseudohalioglobus sediminis]